jgi:hypothetical protein
MGGVHTTAYAFRNSFGSFAKFAVIHRASSRVCSGWVSELYHSCIVDLSGLSQGELQ